MNDNWRLEDGPLGRKPAEGNLADRMRKQVDQIAKSISAFGFNVPLLVDAELNVVAGHGRLLACRKLG